MALPPQINDATVTLTWGSAGVYYGYCTVADVRYEFPDADLYSTLDPSSVAQEITNAGVELQNHLMRIYQMPYTGTDGGILATLRRVNAKLAVSNLFERFFRTSEPNASTAGPEARSWAELILTDVVNGVIQWDSPFGDAIAMGEKPLYPLSSGATIMPDPNSLDPFASEPLFKMSRNRFRDGTTT